MRIKLAALVVGILLVFGGLINWFVIGNLEKDAKTKLEKSLISSFQVYKKAQRANQEERLDVVRKFAAEKNIIDAIMMETDTPEKMEERHFKIFEQVEIISRLRYFGDTYIVTDAEGVELARTQVAQWRKNRFGDRKIVKDALAGESGEDVWLLDGKVTIVDASPIVSEGKVIGILVMCNFIDEDLVKQEKAIVFDDFAYFSRNALIASSLPTDKHTALNTFVQRNSSKIAQVLLSKNDYFEEKLKLVEDTYVVLLSPLAGGQGDQSLAGFMLISSETKWLKEFVSGRNFMLIISICLVLLGISVAFIIIQKAYDAIDFVLEGAHQIIIGNKDYEFTSDDDFLNQLGQTLNLMIAILLGKYIPEDEEEADQMSLRGSLGTGKAGAGPVDRMLIETVEEQADGEKKVDDTAVSEMADMDAYYDKLFGEFIAAKKAIGEDVSLITKGNMVAKLMRAEEKLIEKHGCKKVHFVIKVEKKKVTLKPTPIWD